MWKDNISIPLPEELVLSGGVILFVEAAQTNRGIVAVVSVAQFFKTTSEMKLGKYLSTHGKLSYFS